MHQDLVVLCIDMNCSSSWSAGRHQHHHPGRERVPEPHRGLHQHEVPDAPERPAGRLRLPGRQPVRQERVWGGRAGQPQCGEGRGRQAVRLHPHQVLLLHEHFSPRPSLPSSNWAPHEWTRSSPRESTWSTSAWRRAGTASCPATSGSGAMPTQTPSSRASCASL